MSRYSVLSSGVMSSIFTDKSEAEKEAAGRPGSSVVDVTAITPEPERNTYREYWDTITSTAAEVWEEARQGNVSDVHDRLWEEVDGSQWVIYTHLNLKVIEHSSNEEACFDDMGSGALDGCDNFGAVVQRIAFYAMLRDLEEAYQDIINEKGEPDEQEEEEEEEEDEEEEDEEE